MFHPILLTRERENSLLNKKADNLADLQLCVGKGSGETKTGGERHEKIK